jgi:hypothetical protein
MRRREAELFWLLLLVRAGRWGSLSWARVDLSRYGPRGGSTGARTRDVGDFYRFFLHRMITVLCIMGEVLGNG